MVQYIFVCMNCKFYCRTNTQRLFWTNMNWQFYSRWLDNLTTKFCVKFADREHYLLKWDLYFRFFSLFFVGKKTLCEDECEICRKYPSNCRLLLYDFCLASFFFSHESRTFLLAFLLRCVAFDVVCSCPQFSIFYTWIEVTNFCCRFMRYLCFSSRQYRHSVFPGHACCANIFNTFAMRVLVTCNGWISLGICNNRKLIEIKWKFYRKNCQLVNTFYSLLIQTYPFGCFKSIWKWKQPTSKKSSENLQKSNVQNGKKMLKLRFLLNIIM